MEKVNRVADNCYNFLPNCRIHLGIFLNETLKHELFDYAITQKNTLPGEVWRFSALIRGLRPRAAFAYGDSGKIVPPPPKIRYPAPCGSQHGGGNPAQYPFF